MKGISLFNSIFSQGRKLSIPEVESFQSQRQKGFKQQEQQV